MKLVKLIINISEVNCGDKELSSFPAWLLPNGAVWVDGESTNDWFFNDIDEIEPCGVAIVIDVTVTDVTIKRSLAQLREAAEGSVSEFSYELPAKIKELLA